MSRIHARLQEVLVKQSYTGVDSLVAQVLPVVVEQKLFGSFLGLSSNLSSDAFTFFEPMVIDLKFGEPQKFHRLTTTGYALVMEALHEYPVNLGCLEYAFQRLADAGAVGVNHRGLHMKGNLSGQFKPVNFQVVFSNFIQCVCNFFFYK